MKFVAAAIAVVSIMLGFVSPYIAMQLLSTGEPRHSLLYQWFFGIPAEFLALVPWNNDSAMFAAIGVYIVQYEILFTAIAGTVWLVKWTFSGQRRPA
jgi:hypothetical protein